MILTYRIISLYNKLINMNSKKHNVSFFTRNRTFQVLFSFVLAMLIFFSYLIITHQKISDIKKDLHLHDKDCQINEDCVVMSILDRNNLCCKKQGFETVNQQAGENRAKYQQERCGQVTCHDSDYENELSKKYFKAQCVENSCEIVSANQACEQMQDNQYQQCIEDFINQ